jgi:hypothetical protein
MSVRVDSVHVVQTFEKTLSRRTFAKPAASEVGSQRKRSLLLDLCVHGQYRPQSLALPDHIRRVRGEARVWIGKEVARLESLKAESGSGHSGFGVSAEGKRFSADVLHG